MLCVKGSECCLAKGHTIQLEMSFVLETEMVLMFLRVEAEGWPSLECQSVVLLFLLDEGMVGYGGEL